MILSFVLRRLNPVKIAILFSLTDDLKTKFRMCRENRRDDVSRELGNISQNGSTGSLAKIESFSQMIGKVN